MDHRNAKEESQGQYRTRVLESLKPCRSIYVAGGNPTGGVSRKDSIRFPLGTDHRLSLG